MSIPDMDGAACASVDPELWYPPGMRVAEQREQARQAADICLSCPIQAECLEWALVAEAGLTARERYGIAGGMTPNQRAALAGERAWKTAA